MKASRYLRVSLAKSRFEWYMGGRCITTTGTAKETIEHSIMSGVATYNNWVECPDNASERNKDDKVVPYLKRHFIYINYAKSVYYVGSYRVTNIPSCVFEFIRDTVHDEKGIYRGQSFQLYGNRSPVREVLLVEGEKALRCIRTEMTNKSSSEGVGDDAREKHCRRETMSSSSSDCLVAIATDCVAPTGWTTLGKFMSGSATILGTDTYGVVVVGNTVEASAVVATGKLRTGEPSGTLGVVVEII
jgi:hypothetical protein